MEQNDSRSTAADDEDGKQHRGDEAGDSGHIEQGERHVWFQIRRLLIFQVKLYVDAVRDVLMSPLSLVACILDLLQDNRGDKALFEGLLRFGRSTEKAINLFNQHDTELEGIRGIDSLLSQFEDAVRRDYAEGGASSAAKESLDMLRARLRKAREDSEAA